MKSSRVAATWFCSAALALLACSSSDTIIALNVQSASDVGFVSRLHVTVTQGSKAPFEKDFSMLPTRQIMNAAGAPPTEVIADKFYERFTLPGSFSDGKATLDVTAYDKDGAEYLHPAPVEFEVHEKEATAVFVNLKLPEMPPPMMGEGGMGGMGSTEGGMGGMPSTEGGAGGAPSTEGGAGGAR
ncbi:MAG: hypothetical protein ACOY0T_11890 [Myxococcota bacterium]